MIEPNKQQEQLITNHDGLYCVDAGPGTGKTYTLTKRYTALLDNREKEPDDILMATFTETAADKMKTEISEETTYDQGIIDQAPIRTFHSHCHQLLEEYGAAVSPVLGIEATLSPSFSIAENTIFEKDRFERFFEKFKEQHPEHRSFYHLIDDPSELQSLITELACKGVIPTAQGWYHETGRVLDGDWTRFKERFDTVNTPNQGARGPKNADLKNWLRGFDDKLYAPDAPAEQTVRGGENSIPDRFASEAFQTERSELKSFVHDLYHAYLSHCIEQEQLPYAFLLILSYVALQEDEDCRDAWSFEYVMVDEFQDTNEIQFKLTLLFSATGNIAVVGDWKQSIFAFQYASVENIRSFETRVQEYHATIGPDLLGYELGTIEWIELTTNYRSSQKIIDTAETTLGMAATASDTASEMEKQATSLQADRDNVNTTVDLVECANEKETIIALIQDLVENPEHTYEGKELGYEDIAVLTRKKAFGRDLATAAQEYNVPAAFRGDIELFNTDPGKLVLAWLRILGYGDRKRGWAVVLEDAGYSRTMIETMLSDEDYPTDMMVFRSALDDQTSLPSIATMIFEQYGFRSDITAAIIDELCTLETDYQVDKAGLVKYIATNIDQRIRYDTERTGVDETVTIETIHGSKGKEYPVVIIADVTQASFPDYTTSTPPIMFDDVLGLRQRLLYREDPEPHVCNNWRTEILTTTIRGDYDEERRLFYVAMTRAENELIITAEQGNESRFFTNLPHEPRVCEKEPEYRDQITEHTATIEYQEIEQKVPRKYSAHDLMEPIETHADGRGTEFGTAVHTFAEQYINGEHPDPGEAKDYHNIKGLIDDLPGALTSEQSVLLPLDGHNAVIEGVVDLVHETEEKIQIIDFKTDRSQQNKEAYRKQLSVYYHVFDQQYPSKEIIIEIYYTAMDEQVRVDPVSVQALARACPDLSTTSP
ncbi:MAG: ATP-dependent helicase [Candidatus Nanohaloarchaeota archaeon QJJ-5]|nr:ATP-dependent helicase [Candidatus Nanohaloarchaeota archaeon QJJ-5]